MTATGIRSFSEAAEELGTDPATIRGLVRAHKLKPKPVRLNGRAKGLDESDMRVLRRALGQPVSVTA